MIYRVPGEIEPDPKPPWKVPERVVSTLKRVFWWGVATVLMGFFWQPQDWADWLFVVVMGAFLAPTLFSLVKKGLGPALPPPSLEEPSGSSEKHPSTARE